MREHKVYVIKQDYQMNLIVKILNKYYREWKWKIIDREFGSLI